ncbi:MAG TPA: FAD:protein FMN transferase, partial [Nevskiaceae bacterium]|nr:FAD:protein FMN transferase [Nevskiaceae bacterium]
KLCEMWSPQGVGALGQVNQALSHGEAAEIPEMLAPLLDLARRVQQASDGAFDVRTGRLLRLWGFSQGSARRDQPPSELELAPLLSDLRAARPLGPGKYGPAAVQLDFGGVAPGYIADLAASYLEQNGVHDAIITLGDNIKAIGTRGGKPWKVGIRHPHADAAQSMLASIELQGGEAVLTSGDYEQFFEYQGHRYHSILNPHTGEPAQGLQSVTVVGPSAAWAQAASNALFVAGPQNWRSMARTLGVTQALVVDEGGSLSATAALVARLQFSAGVQATSVP